MRTLSSETYCFYYMPLATNTSNDIKIVPTPTHVPRRADRGNAEETAAPFFCISVQKEVCATHLRRLPFAFSEQALQAAFCSLYMHLRGK